MDTKFLAELDQSIDPELDSLPEKPTRKERRFLKWKAKAHRKMLEYIQNRKEVKEAKERLHLLEKHETAVRHKKRRLKKRTVDI